MQCPKCQAFLDDDTIFCGNCGQQIAPLRARGATAYETAGEKGSRNLQATRLALPDNVPGQPVRPLSHTPPPAWPSRSRQSRRPFLILPAILVLLLAGSTLLALVFFRGNLGNQTPAGNGKQATPRTAAAANGQVLFFDGPNGTGNTDALKITANNLSAAPAGFHYAAWLVDEQAEHATALGNLVPADHAFVLNFSGNGSSTGPGVNLLGLGNVIQITLEQGNVQLPTGKVVLSATSYPQGGRYGES